MNSYTKTKQKINRLFWLRLITASVIVGFLCALLSDALKKLTEHYEELFFAAAKVNWLYMILFPLAGLSLIYCLRYFLFRKKENKGIKEIFESIKNRHNELPVYKIPSHFINGLLTISFGGSTGIEVSTVVASATIGSVTQKKDRALKNLKTELICAGVAAGVTALFNSPVAGLLFAYEVVSKKTSAAFFVSIIIAVSTAFGLNYILHEAPLFTIPVNTWNLHAIPYFILLGIIAGFHSVYLTRCVLFLKQKFSELQKHSYKILVGSAILGGCLLIFPQLYGDGYHSVQALITGASHLQATVPLTIMLLGIIILKPIVTSATLAAGGDGGVFGPSLFMGALLGLFTALVLNTCFHANVIAVNFMAIGMAAVLSASIHAPFTALFLVCAVVGNYILFIPILIACLISKITAKLIYPYTVYSYTPNRN